MFDGCSWRLLPDHAHYLRYESYRSLACRVGAASRRLPLRIKSPDAIVILHRNVKSNVGVLGQWCSAAGLSMRVAASGVWSGSLLARAQTKRAGWAASLSALRPRPITSPTRKQSSSPISLQVGDILCWPSSVRRTGGGDSQPGH